MPHSSAAAVPSSCARVRACVCERGWGPGTRPNALARGGGWQAVCCPAVQPRHQNPTDSPTHPPSKQATNPPTKQATNAPTHPPSKQATHQPTQQPTHPPTHPATHPPSNPPTHPHLDVWEVGVGEQRQAQLLHREVQQPEHACAGGWVGGRGRRVGRHVHVLRGWAHVLCAWAAAAAAGSPHGAPPPATLPARPGGRQRGTTAHSRAHSSAACTAHPPSWPPTPRAQPPRCAPALLQPPPCSCSARRAPAHGGFVGGGGGREWGGARVRASACSCPPYTPTPPRSCRRCTCLCRGGGAAEQCAQALRAARRLQPLSQHRAHPARARVRAWGGGGALGKRGRGEGRATRGGEGRAARGCSRHVQAPTAAPHSSDCRTAQLARSPWGSHPVHQPCTACTARTWPRTLGAAPGSATAAPGGSAGGAGSRAIVQCLAAWGLRECACGSCARVAG